MSPKDGVKALVVQSPYWRSLYDGWVFHGR